MLIVLSGSAEDKDLKELEEIDQEIDQELEGQESPRSRERKKVIVEAKKAKKKKKKKKEAKTVDEVFKDLFG